MDGGESMDGASGFCGMGGRRRIGDAEDSRSRHVGIAYDAKSDHESQGCDQRLRLRAGRRKNVPPAHFGYMASGIDDEVTLRANREAFLKYYLRPRRLNDVSKVDMSMEIFGVRYPSPIIIAPTGGNKAYHPEGEIAVARAARAGNHLEMLATGATTSIDDAIAARGAPV